ncbi:C69 family dipeptidase [Salmonella enterica subsp. enterica serovar Sandiego]|nr:C69 family dipeptidase [Salmonella enterica]EBS3275166.1 dipeptidase [Salmonella enterica subsp. enterica serovar Newport]EBZ3098864.1 C69 family dipeptidase [Salmonella enterica subsp. enterica serovar Sandiego]ECM4657354.1 C69 family dipeptidase [Salmonella enterica subsp. enterica serovar Muenchen]EDI2373899.1 dipeptidase [Salmonella enterica subsp. enterica serovar Poona]EDN4328997.1 C69 family dipeptidase [Salmonella enterica subsp. enterica]
MKITVLASAIALLSMGPAMACTTILVGDKASDDGSFIVARNEDYSATNAKHMVIHPAVDNQQGEFKSHSNDFTWPLPKSSMRYTAIHDFDTQDKSMGEVGFNSVGVGISATETIYNSKSVLTADPYVEKTGITEDSIQTVILPVVKTAREGAEMLGKIIEQKGAGEGFGVAFVDSKEVWYLETGSGHQWLAVRLPADKYFVSANQGRLRQYDPADTANYMASPTLISFAEKHGLYHPKDGAFDFHKAYSQDVENDTVYNYPRVWTLQHMFNPALKTSVEDGKNYPVFLKPEKKISIADVKQALRNHYQNTPHDPYANNNPKEPWRPISVFRTQESHILQVRPNLPKAIGEVQYVAYGMSTLGVYVPYYQGMGHYLPGYDKGSDQASDDSVNWKFRKLQTLVMQDYNAYAPDVQRAYLAFEKQIAEKQKTMEQEYLKLYNSEPKKAQELLQTFEDNTMQDALNLTDSLTNQVFSKMTHATDMKYHFEGA